jgi:hypothetical protein
MAPGILGLKSGVVGLVLFAISTAAAASYGVMRIMQLQALGPVPVPPAPRPDLLIPDAELVPRLVFSGVLLVAALYVILTQKYATQDKHWAYGTIGTLLGFWLKG